MGIKTYRRKGKLVNLKKKIETMVSIGSPWNAQTQFWWERIMKCGPLKWKFSSSDKNVEAIETNFIELDLVAFQALTNNSKECCKWKLEEGS